jgi:multiple sugar transport system substrate-binding protein
MRLFNLTAFALLTASCLCLTGCGGGSHGLSSRSPVQIDVWNYYSGATGIEFDSLVSEFNSSVGREKGIIVNSVAFDSLGSLEDALKSSAVGRLGSLDVPDIFQCYPDNAIDMEEYIELVNLDSYVSENDKVSYVQRFLDAGCIGEDNEWKIFPVTRSTEVLIVNKTEWDSFALETGASTDSLATWEGLVEVAGEYYEWSGGKAFFGRDSLANYIIAGSLQLGCDMFEVSGGTATLNLDSEIMRKLWDYYYVPYVKGYFSNTEEYCSEAIKYNEIIAAATSSASVSYLPKTITKSDGTSYTASYMILALPNFENTAPYAISQGAGMAVTVSDETHEYASVVFLEWLTQSEQNTRLSVTSGYMPVTVEASQTDYLEGYFTAHNTAKLVSEAISMAAYETQKYIMYSLSGFEGSKQSYDELDLSLLTMARNDRAEIEGGAPIEDYLTNERFEEWYEATRSMLSQYCR